MPVDAFAPVLAISTRCDISASGAGEDLLIGSGSNLDVLSCDSNNGHRYVFRARYEIFAERRSNVHGIIQSQHYGDSMIVYGEKSIALVRIGELRVPKRRVVTCDDWIQTVALLDDGSLAVLFACNTIAVYHLVECVAEDSVTLQEYKRIRSSHKAVLFYSLLDGQTWPRLRAIVGTVFGDILVWHPSEGSNVSQRFTGHMGMIFGLLLRDNHLFSISDDRSLRMWSMKSFTQLDEAYGHFARPFAICDATEGAIITAGQDGDVCIWNTNGDLLSLVHRIRIGRGAIRAMLFHRNKIVLGTDGGLKCAIRMTPNLSPPYLVSRLTHKRPIRSFVHLSPTSYFVLDSNGILSILRDGEAKKVMECESARCDSLLLCPSERFVTLSSPRVLFVVSVEYVPRVVSLDFSERIASVLWVGECLIVACESGSLVMCEISKQLKLVRKGGPLLAGKDVPKAAVECDGRIFIGTRKGSIIVIRNDRVIQTEPYCHGRESITDLIVFRSKLISIGRDGKLAVWLISRNQDDKLTLLGKRSPSFWVDMEWPCKFISGCGEALLIAGFRGTSFVLIDYETGHQLCEVNCGGGHRVWHLAIKNVCSNRGTSMEVRDVRLEFIRKGMLIQMDVNLPTVDIISSNAHTSEMSAICTLKGADDEEVLVTAGVDTHLVVSRIAVAGYFPILFRSSMHTSSIYALSALDGFLLSAGGKSQLFLWRYGNGELMLLFTLRMKGDARLVSVQLVETSPRFTFLVAASDSRLAWYILKKDLSGVDSCISLTSALCGTPMMTKVTSHNFEGIHSVYAVSTSGALIIWPDIEIPTKFKVMEIEKAGLSALDVLQWSDHAVVVAGSESGRISAARVRPAEQIVFAHFDWHGATCTDMRIRRSNVEHVVCIVSIALDCRIALFAFSLVSQKIEFRHALVLNVANPSSFCFISKKGREEVDIAIVGSSLQIVSFTDLELLK